MVSRTKKLVITPIYSDEEIATQSPESAGPVRSRTRRITRRLPNHTPYARAPTAPELGDIDGEQETDGGSIVSGIRKIFGWLLPDWFSSDEMATEIPAKNVTFSTTFQSISYDSDAHSTGGSGAAFKASEPQVTNETSVVYGPGSKFVEDPDAILHQLEKQNVLYLRRKTYSELARYFHSKNGPLGEDEYRRISLLIEQQGAPATQFATPAPLSTPRHGFNSMKRSLMSTPAPSAPIHAITHVIPTIASVAPSEVEFVAPLRPVQKKPRVFSARFDEDNEGPSRNIAAGSINNPFTGQLAPATPCIKSTPIVATPMSENRKRLIEEARSRISEQIKLSQSIIKEEVEISKKTEFVSVINPESGRELPKTDASRTFESTSFKFGNTPSSSAAPITIDLSRPTDDLKTKVGVIMETPRLIFDFNPDSKTSSKEEPLVKLDSMSPVKNATSAATPSVFEFGALPKKAEGASSFNISATLPDNEKEDHGKGFPHPIALKSGDKPAAPTFTFGTAARPPSVTEVTPKENVPIIEAPKFSFSFGSQPLATKEPEKTIEDKSVEIGKNSFNFSFLPSSTTDPKPLFGSVSAVVSPSQKDTPLTNAPVTEEKEDPKVSSLGFSNTVPPSGSSASKEALKVGNTPASSRPAPFSFGSSTAFPSPETKAPLGNLNSEPKPSFENSTTATFESNPPLFPPSIAAPPQAPTFGNLPIKREETSQFNFGKTENTVQNSFSFSLPTSSANLMEADNSLVSDTKKPGPPFGGFGSSTNASMDAKPFGGFNGFGFTASSTSNTNPTSTTQAPLFGSFDSTTKPTANSTQNTSIFGNPAPISGSGFNFGIPTPGSSSIAQGASSQFSFGTPQAPTTSPSNNGMNDSAPSLPSFSFGSTQPPSSFQFGQATSAGNAPPSVATSTATGMSFNIGSAPNAAGRKVSQPATKFRSRK